MQDRKNPLPLLVALVSLLLLPLATAEAQPQAEFGEEVEVEEVALDVLVTDRQGNVVVGLDPDDFIVREDGEPVEITDVTFYSNRRFLESEAVAEELGLDPEAVPTDRYFILFFDDPRRFLPRLSRQTLDAARWAKRWVEGDLQPNDYVAVVRYDYELTLVQDFTNDEEELTEAIDATASGKTPPAGEVRGDAPESLLPHWPEGRHLDEIDLIYEALETTALAAGTIPGRKNLVLFSIGFGETNTAGFYTPDPRYYPDMKRILNDNNVATYAVDLLPTTAFAAGPRTVLSNALSNLAADTGGTYYFNFANFITPLESISRETNGYYLITYRSPHPRGETGYQEVTVDTENPRLRVNVREGYRYGEE